jgi:transcriptional regulator with GAF, ATPase, and Fis domain/tetratricopeptide (TPR) repeat protein
MAAARPVPDRYRRLRLLGEGGAGQVWLVEDQLRPGVQLALKEPSEGSARRSEALRREFVFLSRLRHPGLVEPFEFDLGPSDGLPRFTLEHVDGESLAAVFGREGSRTCLALAAEALRVLDFLHDFGLIHRDLKPANLLVRSTPRLGCRLVLLDLGLAVTDDPQAAPAQSGLAGTLPYMAPELFDGAPPTPRSDLYSLGALFYEILHGRPPHLPKNEDLTAFIESVREGRRARPAPPPGYPAGLATWIEELLSPEPGRRPAGMREALARLNALAGTEFPADTATTRAARLGSDPPPGRDAERKALRHLLNPQLGPRVVWLAGPPGSGKSRLLRWLQGDAILREWHVVAPSHGFTAQPPGGRDGSDGLELLRLLRAEAATRPTLLLLDEVESAGGRLVRLLDRIAREGKAPPVQAVAALRPAEVSHPALRRLLDDTGTVPTLGRLDLEPLDSAAIRAVAQRATGSKELSEARLRWLERGSEGNPLLVESLLVEGAWEKGGRGPRSAILGRTGLARLESLSKTAGNWLEGLAALGPEATEADLAALAGLNEAGARAAAEEVRLAGLAVDHEGRWSPASRAVAELVLSRLRGERREEIHSRAAERLLEQSEESPPHGRLARLWSAAGRDDLALRNAVLAARDALADNDPAEGADHFADALRHCSRDEPRRFALRVEQGEALMAAGLYPAAARAFGAALRLAGDETARAELLGRQAHALAQAGRFARARRVAEEALALAESHDLPLPRAQALKGSGIVLGRLGRESEAIPMLEQALELFHRHGDAEMEAETLQNLAACKSRLRRDDAGEDFHRAIALWRELDSPGGELKSLVGLAVIQMRDGKLDEARRLLEEVRSMALQQGNLDVQETALSKLASLSVEQGRLDQAIALGRESLDLARHLGDHNRMMIDRCRLAEALVESGLPAEAMELLREGLKLPLAKVEPDMIDYARLLLARALIETPDAEERDVRLLLEGCQRGFRERRKTRALLLALALEMEWRSRPDGSAPLEPVRLEFEALATQAGSACEPEIKLRAELAIGGALLAKGEWAAAATRARAAAELAATAGRATHRARALGILGEALERLGRGDDAGQARSEGARLLEEAAGLIEDGTVRRSFLERAVHDGVRGRGAVPPHGGDRRLLALYGMIRALNTETDPEALLESILDMALRAVSAERGMIFLRRAPDSSFAVRLARNLERETERDAEEYSRSIVAQAGRGRPILALEAGKDERFRDLKSVSLYGIRSLMCVPLRSRGRIIGTVYLDSRREGTLFTQDDLRFIEAFADHAALALQNVRERADLVQENRRLRAVAEDRSRFANIVGRSAAMQRVFDLIERVADSDLPVLIQGESGTGKELVARAIHFHGPRKRKIILSENCAAIPESLLESELFGHVKGAFTGAERDRPGLFEQAHGGTLFLDEVGDMSPGMQARLLRALQEGEIRRVGADRPVKVDVRVIAATNRELAAEVEAGRFREDLLYRLQVLMIRIPPLRDRPEDIPLLVDHFLERISRERGREAPEIDPPVRELLERHRWPGNVRQLESTLHRLVLLAGAAPLTRQALETDSSLRESLLGDAEPVQARFSLDDGVREQLRRALEAAGGHREKAAKLLGVSRATIYRKLKEHGLK